MASSSSSGVLRRGDADHPICLCGERSRLHVSKTKENPRRRFFNCAGRRCSFFVWIDPPSTVENVVTRAATTTADADLVKIHLCIAKALFIFFLAGLVFFGLAVILLMQVLLHK